MHPPSRPRSWSLVPILLLPFAVAVAACQAEGDDGEAAAVADDVRVELAELAELQCDCPEAWGADACPSDAEADVDAAEQECRDALSEAPADVGECFLALQQDLNACAASCSEGEVTECTEVFVAGLADCDKATGALGYCAYLVD